MAKVSLDCRINEIVEMTILPKDFYCRSTENVARELLGKMLCVRTSDGLKHGRIVETEAYLGHADRACHTFGGRRTKRTETMYRGGGFAYVYFIYGMHFCLNAVTGDEGSGEAVLIRGVEPLGEDLVPIQLPKSQRKTNGPEKLCKFYGITREDDGQKLFQKAAKVIIEDGPPSVKLKIGKAPRIGIESSGEAKDHPLRFFIVGNSYVSK